ncbi:MAG: hypothetical protein ACLU9S_00455 [Oscillospiraceae bacterium]
MFVVRLFLSLGADAANTGLRVDRYLHFGLGTMAGTCAIAVFTFAYIGKQLFEIIETVDMGAFRGNGGIWAQRAAAGVHYGGISPGASDVPLGVLCSAWRAMSAMPLFWVMLAPVAWVLL